MAETEISQQEMLCSIPQQVSCLEQPDDKEYEESLCLPSKKPRGSLLRSLSSHGDYSSVNNTSEQSLPLNDHNAYVDSSDFCRLAVSVESTENDDYTLQSLECQTLDRENYRITDKFEGKTSVDVQDNSNGKNKKLQPKEHSDRQDEQVQHSESFPDAYVDSDNDENDDSTQSPECQTRDHENYYQVTEKSEGKTLIDVQDNSNGKNEKPQPKEHSDSQDVQVQPLESFIPESLEHQHNEILDVQIDEIRRPNDKLVEKQLRELLSKIKEEEIRPDNIDSGDCIKMKGRLGPYHHYGIVESKTRDGVKVIEYTLRDLNLPTLIVLTLIMSLAFLDPLAMLAKAKTSTYTFKELAKRSATKLVFPEELRSNIDSVQIQKFIERVKDEPHFLYSPLYNNCETLNYHILFGIPKSFQVDKHKNCLCFMVAILFSIAATIRLSIIGHLITTYCGVPWLLTCIIHEVSLCLFQTRKVYHLNDLGRQTTKKYEEELYFIWTRALIALVFALFAGWTFGLDDSFWVSSLVILFGNLLGFVSHHMKLSILSTWSWVVVVIWCISPSGTLTNILWFIFKSLLTWIFQSIAVSFIVMQTIGFLLK